MAKSDLCKTIKVNDIERNIEGPTTTAYSLTYEQIERLTIFDTVSMGISVALMAVAPIRSSDVINRLVLLRYSAFCGFTFAFMAVVVGQCAVVFNKQGSQFCGETNPMDARTPMIVTLLLSVVAVIAIFGAMVLLL